MGNGIRYGKPARHGDVGGAYPLAALARIARSGALCRRGSAGGGDAPADFTSIEGVRGIFASDGGATIGWIHYLAFDMFAGLWIARDADAKGFSRWIQAPILFATFMAGPLGLLLWLAIRERRARAGGRWQ